LKSSDLTYDLDIYICTGFPTVPPVLKIMAGLDHKWVNILTGEIVSLTWSPNNKMLGPFVNEVVGELKDHPPKFTTQFKKIQELRSELEQTKQKLEATKEQLEETKQERSRLYLMLEEILDKHRHCEEEKKSETTPQGENSLEKEVKLKEEMFQRWNKSVNDNYVPRTDIEVMVMKEIKMFFFFDAQLFGSKYAQVKVVFQNEKINFAHDVWNLGQDFLSNIPFIGMIGTIIDKIVDTAGEYYLEKLFEHISEFENRLGGNFELFKRIFASTLMDHLKPGEDHKAKLYCKHLFAILATDTMCLLWKKELEKELDPKIALESLINKIIPILKIENSTKFKAEVKKLKEDAQKE